MMAPAMGTGNSELLAYLELAQAGARVRRTVAASDLTRLGQVVGIQSDAVAELEFAFDESGEALAQRRVRVRGHVTADVIVDCQRCLDGVPYKIDATFDLVLTGPDDSAQGIDVIEVDGSNVAPLELVEDELILSLPQRVCIEEPCARMPAMRYGTPGPDAGGDADDEHPFAALKALKIEKQ